jgi:uncharacterized membrane protein
MDLHWTDEVEIATPVERVYDYLADLPKHAEWAQTVVGLELKQPGDASGKGAIYRTQERQGLQPDRGPREALTKGMKGATEAEVTELTRPSRIAWRSRPAPVSMGIHAELAFDLTPASEGRTEVRQTIAFHQPGVIFWMFGKLYFRTSAEELKRRQEAQWQASLDNIKAILEEK